MPIQIHATETPQEYSNEILTLAERLSPYIQTYYSSSLLAERNISAITVVGSILEEYNDRHETVFEKYILQRQADIYALGYSASKSHSEIFVDYQRIKNLKAAGDELPSKINEPVLLDVGVGNIQIFTAIRLLKQYQLDNTTTDPLNLNRFVGDYDGLVSALLDQEDLSATTAFATLMIEDGIKTFETYADNWSYLSAKEKEALLVYYYNVGKEFVINRHNEAEAAGQDYNPRIFYDVSHPSTPGTEIGIEYLANRNAMEQRLVDAGFSYSTETGDYSDNEVLNSQLSVEVTNQEVEFGTSISVTDLFPMSGWTDNDGPSDIVRFAIADRTEGGGYLTENGVIVAAGLVVERNISEVSNIRFHASSTRSVDEIGFNIIQADNSYSRRLEVGALVFSVPAPTTFSFSYQNITEVRANEQAPTNVSYWDWEGTSGDDQSGSINTAVRIRGHDGDDYIRAGGANNVIYGDDGDDRLEGHKGHDEILGGRDRDKLYGGSGHDRLFGEQDRDWLYGGTGDDFLSGGSGDDYLDGDEDNDQIFGDTGDDDLRGGDGHDLLYGQDGEDDLRGEDGDDQLYGGDENDSLRGGDGIDRLAGENGNDTLRGENGADELFGGNGNDWLSGGAGDDLIHGESGIDTASFTYSQSSVSVNMFDEVAVGEHSGNDVLWGIENVEGSPYEDIIDGNDASNELSGGGGADRIRGHGGNDTLHGGSDGDVLWGDAGNDTVEGGSGSDELRGGLGSDVLRGGSGDDYLRGEQLSDIIDGGNGVDTAFFWGKRQDFEIKLLDDLSLSIKDMRAGGLEGTDTLHNIEYIEFFDSLLAVHQLFEDNPEFLSDETEPDILSIDSSSIARVGTADFVASTTFTLRTTDYEDSLLAFTTTEGEANFVDVRIKNGYLTGKLSDGASSAAVRIPIEDVPHLVGTRHTIDLMRVSDLASGSTTLSLVLDGVQIAEETSQVIVDLAAFDAAQAGAFADWRDGEDVWLADGLFEELTFDFESALATGDTGSDNNVVSDAADLPTFGTIDFTVGTKFTLNTLDGADTLFALTTSAGVANFVDVRINNGHLTGKMAWQENGESTGIAVSIPLSEVDIQAGVEHSVLLTKSTDPSSSVTEVVLYLDEAEVGRTSSGSTPDFAAFDHATTGVFVDWRDGTEVRPADGTFGELLFSEGVDLSLLETRNTNGADGPNPINDADNDNPTVLPFANAGVDRLGIDDFSFGTSFTLNTSDGADSILSLSSADGEAHFIDVRILNGYLTAKMATDGLGQTARVSLDQLPDLIGENRTVQVSRLVNEQGNGSTLSLLLDGAQVASSSSADVLDFDDFDFVQTSVFVDWRDGGEIWQADGSFGDLMYSPDATIDLYADEFLF